MIHSFDIQEDIKRKSFDDIDYIKRDNSREVIIDISLCSFVCISQTVHKYSFQYRALYTSYSHFIVFDSLRRLIETLK